MAGEVKATSKAVNVTLADGSAFGTVTVDETNNTVTLTGSIDATMSQSGKSVLLVSTRGTAKTGATYKGHPVSLNVNISIPNPEAPAKAPKAPPKKVTIG